MDFIINKYLFRQRLPYQYSLATLKQMNKYKYEYNYLNVRKSKKVRFQILSKLYLGEEIQIEDVNDPYIFRHMLYEEFEFWLADQVVSKKFHQFPQIIINFYKIKNYGVVLYENLTLDILEKLVCTSIFKIPHDYDIVLDLLNCSGDDDFLSDPRKFDRFKNIVAELDLDNVEFELKYDITDYVDIDNDQLLRDVCHYFQIPLYYKILNDIQSRYHITESVMTKLSNAFPETTLTTDMLEDDVTMDELQVLIKFGLQRGYNFKDYFERDVLCNPSNNNMQLFKTYFNITSVDINDMPNCRRSRINYKVLLEHFPFDLNRDESFYRLWEFEHLYNIQKPKQRSTYIENLHEIIEKDLFDKVIDFQLTKKEIKDFKPHTFKQECFIKEYKLRHF